MALYSAAIQKPIKPGPNDPPIKPRVVILHVAVFIGKSLYDYFKERSGGVESHFYIRLDGTVEQYRSTDIQADANTDANDFAISIETEGMEYGVWTPEQLAAIKALLLWCHKTHGIPLVRCPAWDGSGIGYHTLFPGRWDKRGASCPGPDRKLQFNQVIVPWMRDGGDEDDGMKLTDRIIVTQADGTGTENISYATFLNRQQWVYAETLRQKKVLEALAANDSALLAGIKALAANPSLPIEQLVAAAKAGALAALAETIDSATVNLTIEPPKEP